MVIDAELKAEFVKEIRIIQAGLKSYVDSLSDNVSQPKKYELYGQAIDRIYGTATTLGFTELGQYCKAMKDLTYMCSNSDNIIGQKKVFVLMTSSIENLDSFIKSLDDKNELLRLNSQIKIAINKVSVLEKGCFASVKDKKSCA